MNTAIRSGGFHLLVLFLGGTGTIMEDCRLAETMETIHALNIVVHVGKQVLCESSKMSPSD